jgi:hypothetical protein
VQNQAATELAKAREANARKAEGDKKVSTELVTVVDNNIGDFCDIGGKKAQRTLGEKEQDFLMALQSFYDSGACALRTSRWHADVSRRRHGGLAAQRAAASFGRGYMRTPAACRSPTLGTG